MNASGVPLRELGLILLVAAAVTYLATGPVRSVLVRTGRVAEIRTRDVHTQPTPSLGGLAMLTGFLAALALAQQLPALTRGFAPVTPEMTAVLVGGLSIVLVGVLDDLYELRALTKLIGQFVAAIVMTTLGIVFTVFYVPLGEGTTLILDQTQGMVLSALFTVLLLSLIHI